MMQDTPITVWKKEKLSIMIWNYSGFPGKMKADFSNDPIGVCLRMLFLLCGYAHRNSVFP